MVPDRSFDPEFCQRTPTGFGENGDKAAVSRSCRRLRAVYINTIHVIMSATPPTPDTGPEQAGRLITNVSNALTAMLGFLESEGTTKLFREYTETAYQMAIHHSKAGKARKDSRTLSVAARPTESDDKVRA